MAAFQNFRSAFNGFNREDVVHYIEFVNNKHTAEVNQLNSEIQSLRFMLEKQKAPAENEAALTEQLEEARTNAAALEQEIAELRAQLESAAAQPRRDDELEAYRRAERAERLANERVAQLYTQANGVLADVTLRTDETVKHVTDMTDSVCAQLAQLQTTLATGANAIRDTAAAMYAIKPLSTEE